MAEFIDPKNWKTFLDEFTKRNQFRATRLEVLGDLGAQEEEDFLPLVGVNLESKGSAAGGVVVILGGETAQDGRHVEHQIMRVRKIALIVGDKNVEDGLGFEDEDGSKTLLLFEELLELPENTG